MKLKQNTIKCIDEMVFMEKKNVFKNSDVILYHPGHFPELNEQLLEYYKKAPPSLIMIPEAFNPFLNESEYEFYAPLLINEGIQREKLLPIPVNTEMGGVEGVIQSAFRFLNTTNHKNILLAGKSFFSRRFYLLATGYSNDNMVIDVLPLEDKRGITPTKWTESEKGKARVLNEIEQYSKIIKTIL
jgi:hypothetical protein